MTQGRSKLGYVPELDGLRGVAILAVMGFHSSVPFFTGGHIGVDIFFVLSGFLITTLLIQEFDESGSINLRHFYMRRVLRLGPALIAFLMVFCLASFALLSEAKAHRNYVEAVISLAYIQNFAMGYSIYEPTYLGHTWSLSTEEQFYMVWPIILFMLLRVLKNRYYVSVISPAIALLSLLSSIYLSMDAVQVERLYYGFDTRAGALMIGSTLGIASGLVTENAKIIFQKLLTVIAPLSVACLLPFLPFGDSRDPWMYYFGFFVVELLTAALVLDILLNPRSIIRRLLAMRWLVWIGSISYGLYLWHPVIYSTIAGLGFYNLSITVGTPLSVLVAALSYYVLETPILKLKKRFTRSAPINSPQPASAMPRCTEASDA